MPASRPIDSSGLKLLESREGEARRAVDRRRGEGESVGDETDNCHVGGDYSSSWKVRYIVVVAARRHAVKNRATQCESAQRRVSLVTSACPESDNFLLAGVGMGPRSEMALRPMDYGDDDAKLRKVSYTLSPTHSTAYSLLAVKHCSTKGHDLFSVSPSQRRRTSRRATSSRARRRSIWRPSTEKTASVC